MKKLIALLLVFSFIFSFSACKGENEIETTTEHPWNTSNCPVVENCNNNAELINKRENMVKDVSYIKCIETNDILSELEWIKLGYTNIKNAYKSTKLYKNKHFIKVSRDEYLEYLKNNFDKLEVLKRNYDTKPKEIIYAKCVETSEIHSSTEWRKLGYSHVKRIVDKRNIEKGKHFIKSTKEEYESYLKQLSTTSA